MNGKAWKPETELIREIKAAAEKVTVGARYAHFRHPEQHYTVVDVIWDAAVEEPSVLYRAEYGLGITFVRPVRIWLETVEHEGKIVPRFTKVADK